MMSSDEAVVYKWHGARGMRCGACGVLIRLGEIMESYAGTYSAWFSIEPQDVDEPYLHRMLCSGYDFEDSHTPDMNLVRSSLDKILGSFV